MEKLIDLSEKFDCVKAEGKGQNVLILRKLPELFQRFDKKMARYELEYRWLSLPIENDKNENWVCVQGQEFTYWQKKEVAKVLGGKSLFDSFNLF